MRLVTYTRLAVVLAVCCVAVGWLGIAGWLGVAVLLASVAMHVAGNAIGTRMAAATDLDISRQRGWGWPASPAHQLPPPRIPCPPPPGPSGEAGAGFGRPGRRLRWYRGVDRAADAHCQLPRGSPPGGALLGSDRWPARVFGGQLCGGGANLDSRGDRRRTADAPEASVGTASNPLTGAGLVACFFPRPAPATSGWHRGGRHGILRTRLSNTH